MKQKKVLIIGAGPAQYQGIAKAKQKGLFTIVTDRNPHAPGLAIADVPLVLDVKDTDGSIEVARRYQIDGIFSVASEVSVLTVAAVAEEIGLPGLRLEVARIVTDKALMREKYAEHAVPSPDFRVVFSPEEASRAVKELSIPVVIKPADNAGSRGVSLVDEESQVEDAFVAAEGFSEQGKVIIESFMEGVEVSVEAFVYQGKAEILALSDKIRTLPPYLLDTTVIFPSGYPAKVQDGIVEITRRAIKAVGINDGPVHIEIMMTPDGPKMVELAARGPGFKVFTDIIPYVTGVDVVEGVIKLALGEEPDLTIRANRGAVLKFIEARPGRIKEIRGIEQVKGIHEVYDFEFYLGIGDKIKPLTCGDDRVGHIISFANSREEAIEVVKRAEKLLIIEVEPI
ncbi:ATP-grasp domain-containing protein [Chloroflexota bacterium]